MPTCFTRAQKLAIVIALVLGAGAAALTPSADGDVYWHLAAAREMLATRGWLHSDPFSVSAAGRPWANVHWLFQLAIYGVHWLGGLGALVVGKAALLAFAAVILLRAQKRTLGEQALFVVLFVAAMICVRNLILVRPVLITLLCLALFFYLLERHRIKPGWGTVVWLAVVQLVWANCQGLSALGPLLIAVYAVGAASFALLGQRAAYPFVSETDAAVAPRGSLLPLGAALIASLVASCVTPYGAGGLALSGTLFGRLLPAGDNVYAHGIVENAPPLWLEQVHPGEFAHLKWYLLVVAVFFVLSARRLRLSHTLLVLAFVGLALLANRNVLLLYVMATPILAHGLWPAIAARLAGIPRARSWFTAATALAISSVVGVASVTAGREPSIREPAPFRMPVASARLISEHPGAGRIFAADHQGGYLSWMLYPRYLPFADTRWVLRSPEEFRDYLRVTEEPRRFDELDRAQHFSYVVLPVAYPERYLGLIAHLAESSAWRLVFTDASEVLFARREQWTNDDVWALDSPATSDRVLDDARQRYGDRSPLFNATRLHLATLQLALGAYSSCERVLASDHSPEAAVLLARCLVADDQLVPAQTLGERLLRADGEDVRGLDVLAMVYARRGDRRMAETFVQRALRRDPFDREASTLLSSLEGRPDDNP